MKEMRAGNGLLAVTLIGLMTIMSFLSLSAQSARSCTECEVPGARTYSTDADFDEGVLVGVEHTTVPDQLQLLKGITTLPFIWVPNDYGSISKVSTETGNELGRYYVAPPSLAPSPSRTTVDLRGNVWVGNRQAGTVVKIGLNEAGQCTDRNHNGIIETSSDLNGDGVIESSEMLDWGKDECVLYEVVLIDGQEGTYVPGTFTGAYDTGYWSTSPRGLAIDSQNMLWAGTWSSGGGSCKYYHLAEDGTIEQTVDTSPVGHNAYGAVVDKNGILWSSGFGNNHVLRMDPSQSPPALSIVSLTHYSYGLGIDSLSHLFVSGWDNNVMSRINVQAQAIDWTSGLSGLNNPRGVAATADNNIWTVNSYGTTITRYDNDGNLKATISIPSSGEPTGVAVDSNGKVWAMGTSDENLYRIDPATNAIDLTKQLPDTGGHYGYSDMTGFVSRNVTTKTGTWTVIHDSGQAGSNWGAICWNADVPTGTSLTVRARSSKDQTNWSAWEIAGNAIGLSATPKGQFIQVEVTFQILPTATGTDSPVLYDLIVAPKIVSSSIKVLEPNGSEVWKVRSTHTIRWEASGVSGNVRIQVSWDGGITWKTIERSRPARLGVKPWTAYGPSKKVLVRVTSVRNRAVSDTSDNVFTIRWTPSAIHPTP